MQIDLAGVKTNYTESGTPSGIPLVFIHGFPFSHEMWDGQVALLKDQFRVITYDVRGHGQTPAGDGQVMLELFVDDLIGLLDALKIDRAILCGLSMGGYVALRMVERNPERVRALVLCDTRSEADTSEGKVKRAAGLKTIKSRGVSAFAEGFLKSVFTEESFRIRPEVVDKIRKTILSNPPLGVAGTLIALASRTDTTAALPGIKVPTLILVGEKDPVTPPAAAESLHQKIAGSELHIIPNASHLSNLENPEVFNQHLLSFLQKIR